MEQDTTKRSTTFGIVSFVSAMIPIIAFMLYQIFSVLRASILLNTSDTFANVIVIILAIMIISGPILAIIFGFKGKKESGESRTRVGKKLGLAGMIIGLVELNAIVFIAFLSFLAVHFLSTF